MKLIRLIVGVASAIQIVYWSSTTPFYAMLHDKFHPTWLINIVLLAAGFVAFAFVVRPNAEAVLRRVASWSNILPVCAILVLWALAFAFDWEGARNNIVWLITSGYVALVVGPPLATFVALSFGRHYTLDPVVPA